MRRSRSEAARDKTRQIRVKPVNQPVIINYNAARSAPPKQTRFLGMTPSQRFVLAIMLLILTVFLSSFCLVITGRMVLPF